MRHALNEDKPFFCYLNPTRMHVVTHLSEKYEKMRNAENGWSVYEAGMAQLDDIVGAVFQRLKEWGIDENTIVVFTTDNGAECISWPDGGQTPFRGEKGTVLEGGFRVPCIVRWPGKVPAGKVENGIMSGLDWFPTLLAAAGDPNIVDELKRGARLAGRNFRCHLDGYNQLSFITGQGPSLRKEIFYFAEGELGAIRIGDYKYRFLDQPNGWLGGTVKVDWPILTNIRLDPFERTGIGQSLGNINWFMYEFWRFVFVQEVVAKFGQSFIDYPPLQAPASFNLDAVKAKVAKAIQAHHGA
jgi:arylsulfatase